MKYDDMQYPFHSRRYVIYGNKGMVVTSQYLASQAGLNILKAGGNAVDAAIAAAACLTVVEPCSNGIGGDAFALVWMKDKLYGLNSSGPAPMSLSAEKLISLGYTSMPTFGWETVTVPGIPAAWAALQKRFGKLTLSDNLKSAITYAQEGFPVSPIVANEWGIAASLYRDKLKKPLSKYWYDTFTLEGRAPQGGEIFYMPFHATTLEEIGNTDAKSFYNGKLGSKLVSFAKDTGGYLTESDLALYAPEWVEPLSTSYRGYDIWELPPNGHGLVTLIALNILQGYDPFIYGDTNALHRQIEALKLAYADGLKYIADPKYMKENIYEMLSPEYAAKRRLQIGNHAQIACPGEIEDHGTVYLAVADREGNMVSYIQSNYMGFGSGLVVPCTGISLHNRGANFNLNPLSPNYLIPGKRPYHTIIPGFITKDGAAIGPFGVMGGFMQPQGHIQILINMLDYGFNPQAALDCPRWRWDKGLEIELEKDFDPHLKKGLLDYGHKLQNQKNAGFFGRGQIVLADKGVYIAGTESRADSAVAVW